MRKKKRKISFLEKMLKIKHAGIQNIGDVNMVRQQSSDIETLDERITQVLQLVYKTKILPTHMIYFVMYDIENNRVRRNIAKFLLRKGCIRVQKSIFLAQTERKVYNEIFQALRDVHDIYDNHDSIFLVPVSTDELRSMKIIGHNINFDFILNDKSTLFF
jgi:CRISPR-associated protein Cas2